MPKKFLKGALSGGLSAAPSGNPYLIAGSALAGGVLNELQPDYEYDPTATRSALDRLRSARMNRANRVADEVGSRTGSQLAARGLQDTALGQGYTDAVRRMVTQGETDKMNELEAQVELQIADRMQQTDQMNVQSDREDLAALAGQGFGLVDRLSNPTAFDSPGLRKLRDVLKMENVDPIDIEGIIKESMVDLGDGNQVSRNSPLGQMFQQSSDFVKELAGQYAGGMKGLIALLGSMNMR